MSKSFFSGTFSASGSETSRRRTQQINAKRKDESVRKGQLARLAFEKLLNFLSTSMAFLSSSMALSPDVDVTTFSAVLEHFSSPIS